MAWHFPQLKQGDSCFYHYCIGEYLTVLQCLTQCPQAGLYCSRMPYGTVFCLYAYCICSPFFRIWCLHSYPGHGPRDILGTPRYEYADFLPEDSGSHSNCRSGCSDTSLVLCRSHFHTRLPYIPAFWKTLPRKHLLWILPVYGYGASPSHSGLRYRWFGFHAPAALTVSAGNHDV